MSTGMTRLAGKVAIVTGGAQGIGRAIAMRLVEEGARVAIADIQEAVAGETAQQLTTAGGEAIAVQLDVTSLESATAAVQEIERAFGGIDILVNNAGWDKLEPFIESTPETWDKVIAINFRGVLHCCKAVIPKMQMQGGGKIVSIPLTRAGSARWAKQFIQAVKVQLSHSQKLSRASLPAIKINVNVVCPGPTETALLHGVMDNQPKVLEAMKRGIPMRRLGTA